MRTGPSLAVIHSPAQIDPGVIIDSNIDPTANIDFTKLNCAAIDTNLVPDADDTRSIGVFPLRFYQVLAHYLRVNEVSYHLIPDTDDVLTLGSSSFTWHEVWAQTLKGPAATELKLWALAGGA